MGTRASGPSRKRTPVEEALRNLGARRYGEPVGFIEYAIAWADSEAEAILQPLAASTAVLVDWTPAERAQAVWTLIEEGIAHPHVSGIAGSREHHALQAAFRMPIEDIGAEWGASLTDRFKQLRKLRSVFGEATSIQPIEIAWKHGVERLADHVESHIATLRTPADWARYRSREPADTPHVTGPTLFRAPSEGAQKLVVNLYTITLLMKGRLPARRIAERLITSQDDGGLRYFLSTAYLVRNEQHARAYFPTTVLWGCRAEEVEENGMTHTRLWFPRPLRTGEQAHFTTEVFYGPSHDHRPPPDHRGQWTNVDVDHYGIDPGQLHAALIPLSGLTIRIRFDLDDLPKAVWWYAEQNEMERYEKPPAGSPHQLEIIDGEVTWTFDKPCEPRESYGLAYRW